jgi:hypothetical protein
MPNFHRIIAKKKRKIASSAHKSGRTPEVAPEVAVSPPTIYVLSKQSPRSLNLTMSVSALLDSGATGNFVSPEFVSR